ncbi:hypothetical protein Psta_2297 [Pirellula staleyi DSM 6068]|uniref:Uncharacterized protein n=1 Tax=Pirellula staleyi (strain ATCC 27377 / DSM 6068 / ICPB 4128) TaxID=530564 RepID=D2R3L3_PIRSD|nr:hypothetical protein [Pirellula staleyi]ADB16967.1 hypothetical protein Psta_2297 [Pirellula staleyi DSM 6068]
MHARQLVEIGALVALHGKVLASGMGRIPKSALEQYWTASKCRLERWQRIIPRSTDTAIIPHDYQRLRVILEEVLASELLTRTFTAAAIAYDRVQGEAEVEPIARSVMMGHQEARNRVLSLILLGRGFDFGEAVALNRLRRRVERWCDMLLAHFASSIDIEPLAFEPTRVKEFAADFELASSPAMNDLSQQLAIASLRASFRSLQAEPTPNADLNERIATSVLGCFRDELFDSTGILQSLWINRLSQTASDTAGMIEDLIRLDDIDGEQHEIDDIEQQFSRERRPQRPL